MKPAIVDCSVSPSIYLSSCAEHSTAEHKERGRWSYSRVTNPNFSILEAGIEKQYRTDRTVLFPSGMSAISATLSSLLPAHTAFMYDTELYCGTSHLIQTLSQTFSPQIPFLKVDLTKEKALEKAERRLVKRRNHKNENKDKIRGERDNRKKTAESKSRPGTDQMRQATTSTEETGKGGDGKEEPEEQERQEEQEQEEFEKKSAVEAGKILIFTESCSNPSGRVPDLAALMRRFPQSTLVVDNSWLSVCFDPFKCGAQLVIESISKHIGAGQCIAGMVTGFLKQPWMKSIRKYANLHGLRMSQFDAALASYNLPHLRLRLHNMGQVAWNVAAWLSMQPFVEDVQYPLLPHHSTFATAIAQFQPAPKIGEGKGKGTVAPSLIWFLLGNLTKQEAISTMDSETAKQHGIKFATSYGKGSTLFDPYPKYDKQRHGTWVRLSIGFEATLQETLEALKHIFQDLVPLSC